MTILIIHLFFFISTLFYSNGIFNPFLVIFRPLSNHTERAIFRTVPF